MQTEQQEYVSQLLIDVAKLSDMYEVVFCAEELQWWFVVDDDRLVMVEYDQHTETLVFTAEVIRLVDIPQSKRMRAFTQALAYNALWRETAAYMSLLPEDDSLHLMLRLPENSWEVSHVCQVVSNLTERSEDWNAAFRGEVQPLDDFGESVDDGSFLRV